MAPKRRTVPNTSLPCCCLWLLLLHCLPQSTHLPGGKCAHPASENLKTLILTLEILYFTEESFGKEDGSRVASQGALA